MATISRSKMTVYRFVLLVLVFHAVFGWSNAEKTGNDESGALEEAEYNPKCRPLEEFDQEQSKDTRVKREEPSEKETQDTALAIADDEIVAQPGYVVPAGKRRLCFGRRRAFTEGCGPPAKAYRVRNFVMAKNPAMRRRQFPRLKPAVNNAKI